MAWLLFPVGGNGNGNGMEQCCAEVKGKTLRGVRCERTGPRNQQGPSAVHASPHRTPKPHFITSLYNSFGFRRIKVLRESAITLTLTLTPHFVVEPASSSVSSLSLPPMIQVCFPLHFLFNPHSLNDCSLNAFFLPNLSLPHLPRCIA